MDENGAASIASTTTADVAHQRIDDLRRQGLADNDPTIALLEYLKAQLMDTLVNCDPGLVQLLSQDEVGGREVADRQRSVNAFLQIHRQTERYTRLAEELKQRRGA